MVTSDFTAKAGLCPAAVTRAEEWCVEAETAEEARELLAQGCGHRCHLGDRLHAEVQELDE